MWVDFDLSGVTYQKAVSKQFPFTLGPPVGFPGAETDAKLFEWNEAMSCIMPAADVSRRQSPRAISNRATLEPNAVTAELKMQIARKK
eukprot:13135706-Heterocapsa_arctica.AAC.1